MNAINLKSDNMAFKVNVSYGASSKTKIAAGEFTAEAYIDIPETVKALLEEAYSRVELENLKDISVTIDAKLFEDEDE